MGNLFQIIINLPILRGIFRPFTRLLVGLIAIPIFRFVLKRIFRLQKMDKELEKDLEEWFRGALLLLVATANMEPVLFWWFSKVDWLERADWFTMGLRLMLAIGVIEAMPDQELFAVMHPGPPRLQKGVNFLRQIWQKKWIFVKGFACRHLNRSSPVLAMMCAIVGSSLPSAADHNLERWLVGWICYAMAITQYLIIGLVTRRDQALEMLSEFDRAVAERRQEMVEEFKEEGNLPEDFDPASPISEVPPQEVRDKAEQETDL